MEQVQDIIQQTVNNMKKQNQNATAIDGLEKQEKKQNLEERPLLLKYLTAISDECPYHSCNGSGFIRVAQVENGEEVVRFKKCECMGVKQRPEIKRQSKIPLEYQNCTIKSFDIGLYQDQETARSAKKAAVNFVTNFIAFQQQGKGVYLYSKTKGSGKTRLACSIANALIQTQKIQVKFLRTLDLLDMIKDTYKKNSGLSEKEVLDSIKYSKVLILDDIGAEKPTEWVCGIFLSLLDYRISNRLVTLFTSNVHKEKLKLDERVVDRIYKMALDIHLPEESIRRLESEKEAEALKKLLQS